MSTRTATSDESRTRQARRRGAATSVAVAVLLMGGLPADASHLVPTDAPDGSDSTDGFVYAIARDGDTIYLGGEFTEVGGKPRANLAAVDASTGRVTDWAPVANKGVQSIDVAADGTVYVAGKFGRIDGKPRKKAAAIAPDGSLLNWKPNITKGIVLGLRVAGERVYVGGRFKVVDGVSRPYLAALSTASARLVDWDPRAGGEVWDIEVDVGGDIWVAGKYFAMGGANRRGIAELDPGSGNASSFDSAIRVPAYDLALEGDSVYLAAGGSGGKVITYKLDQNGAVVWYAQTDGDMQAIDASSDVVFAGGHQTRVTSDGRTLPRQGLVALDAVTGEILPWDPTSTGGKNVYRVLVTDDSLLVGGQFRAVSGVPKGGFARFPWA